MDTKKLVSLLVLGLVVFLVYSSIFFVDEREQALVSRLGKIVDVATEPGLHFKRPVVDTVVYFEKRLLTADAEPEHILTGEKKQVEVDYFVKWRIIDVRKYYLTYGSVGINPQRIETNAVSQLADTIKDALQAQLGDRTIEDVVWKERDVIMQNLTRIANERMLQVGVEVVDVRIKKMELPAKVRDSIFKRMRAERARIANELRAKGAKQARIIRAGADRQQVELIADAQRRADILRGEGDARATEIYAQAYGQDREFYAFYRSLEGYRNAFTGKDDVLVLDSDSEFFRYFDGSGVPRK
ncbi:MAG TPA: protease modulator HflC [Gammaproteobacteria bacterium]|nr:protease modulator HflC [Gammaproteobacteria bacterium]